MFDDQIVDAIESGEVCDENWIPAIRRRTLIVKLPTIVLGYTTGERADRVTVVNTEQLRNSRTGS